MMNELVKVISEENIAEIRINRPEHLNSLNIEVLKQLSAKLKELAATAPILIITGQGDKAFVAGADIAEMKDMNSLEAAQFSRLGQEIFKKIYCWPNPTIAAINGYALGGGCELALACDIRIASPKAKLGQPEIGLGIIPGFGATYFLQKVVGLAKAKELIFFGEVIDAETAKSMGLINQIATADVLTQAKLLAQKLAQKSKLALRSAKLSLTDQNEVTQALERERELFCELFSFDDQEEGMSAFLEKRRPNFSGK